MITLTLGSILTSILAVLFIVLCLFMVLVILIQKPRGGGLAGAFGGSGGGQAAVFGAKTGDVLTWFTIVFFVLFLGLAMGLVYSTRADSQAGIPTIAPADAEQSPVDLATPPITGSEAPPAVPSDLPPVEIPSGPIPAPEAAPEAPAPDAPESPAPAPQP